MNFLIHPERRVVLLQSPPEERWVLNTLPAGSTVDRRLAIVPYTLNNTRWLRSVNIPVPSPIGYYYIWPRDKKLIPHPMEKQIETSGFLTLNNRAYCLNSIGTGKTMSAAWASDYLMTERVIRKVLVVSPLSTLERVWGDSIFFHLRHRTCAVLHGTAAKRRQLFLQPHDYYVVNHDGFELLCQITKDTKGQRSIRLLRDDIDLVIIDELAVYRNGQTEKHKILRAALKPSTWVWGLTGTPIPNAPTDAWAQCRIITPHTVPGFFTSFKNQTMQQVTMYKWVPRKEALEVVYKAMQPAIRFAREEVFTLPGELHTERSVELTKDQKKHYQELLKELYTEINEGKVTAVNEGVKILKLLQVACGVVYDKTGVQHEIDCKPRVSTVLEIIEEAGEKVLVFAPFTGSVHMLHREISKHWTCEMVYGKTSPANRNRIFSAFQDSDDPHVIVADAGCMSHGLTLTQASTIIWYAPTTSNEEYVQANGRITRAGQTTVANIVHIEATTLERAMYKRLKDKTALQGLLLNMVKNGGLT